MGLIGECIIFVAFMGETQTTKKKVAGYHNLRQSLKTFIQYLFELLQLKT